MRKVSRDELKIREMLKKAKLRPNDGGRNSVIYRAVRNIYTQGRVFYIIGDTPGQHEDYIRVLVDDKIVLSFEIERNNPHAAPYDVKIYSIKEFREEIGGGKSERNFEIALKYAKEDLSNVFQ